MKHIVSINDHTRKGALLLNLLKEFKKSNAIRFLSESETEEREDTILLEMMKAGRISGKASTEKVLAKLGIK